ncbi:MAG TPA: hypothetical protein PLY87_21345 [Planctomycetaceae bacterium]|nr:hypothetical protein [Planctomycetaceae bacterium]HQZ67655.1 hypothetical protein [Planctomycetaceae bacterium]
MKNGFWVGGAEQHLKAVTRNYNEQMSRLQLRLKDCNSEEQREALKIEIEALESMHKSRLKGIGDLLF